MAFLIYFFVLLVSAASVLFGLDLMSSPLPNTPNVPIGRSVQIASQPPARERQKRVADERALTPVYPTEPGKPKIPAETSGAAPQEHATEQQQATLTPPPDPSVTPAPVTTPAPAPAVEVKAEPAGTAQPAAQQAPSSCNVQACGAAYHSFRAADCSYQPAGGPRRACTMTPGAITASVPKPQQARQVTGKDEMREVERIVKRQPLQITPSSRPSTGNGEMREVERIVRRMTRNENADVAVQDGDGNIIVVRKGYR